MSYVLGPPKKVLMKAEVGQKDTMTSQWENILHSYDTVKYQCKIYNAHNTRRAKSFWRERSYELYGIAETEDEPYVGRRHIKGEAFHQVDLVVGYFKSGATQLTLDKDHKQNTLERAWEDHEAPSVLGVHSFNKY